MKVRIFLLLVIVLLMLLVNRRWHRTRKDKVPTCSGAQYILILYKLGHGAEEDTTFSYTEHNLLKLVFCTVYHDERVPSLCGS